MKANDQSHKNYVSYELYRELSSDFFSPIDDCEMPLDLRFELYLSKLTFLYNIQEQCFKAINHSNSSSLFQLEDLKTLQKAIEVTKDFVSQTIKDRMNQALEKGKKLKVVRTF